MCTFYLDSCWKRRFFVCDEFDQVAFSLVLLILGLKCLERFASISFHMLYMVNRFRVVARNGVDALNNGTDLQKTVAA